MDLRRHGWLPWVLAGVAAAAVWGLMAFWIPSGEARHSICFTRRVLGVSCAGCGMTRAMGALARGDWWASVTLHPLAPFLAAQAGLVWLTWGATLVGWLRPPVPRFWWILFGSNLALLVGVWVARIVTGTLPP